MVARDGTYIELRCDCCRLLQRSSTAKMKSWHFRQLFPTPPEPLPKVSSSYTAMAQYGDIWMMSASSTLTCPMRSFRMDSLLADTLILWKSHCAGYDVQRRRALKIFRGSRKPFRARAKTVRLPAGITVRLHPGIVFAFTTESRSPCPGIRSFTDGVGNVNDRKGLAWRA